MGPKPSKDDGGRDLDLVEEDGLDEQLLASWVEQASGLPGAAMSDERVAPGVGSGMLVGGRIDC